MPDPSAPLRLLVIEDEAPIRRFLRIVLEGAGHVMDEATRGREGIERAATGAPSAVVLDLGLPDMDGKAVIAGYIVAGERALRRGCALSVGAALLQACVAGAIVGVGSLILNATAASLTRAGTLIETASFALVAAVGLALTWRKAGRLARLGAACGPGCCGRCRRRRSARRLGCRHGGRARRARAR